MPSIRVIPIFDTNVFGDVQRQRISPADWRYLLRRRPGRGWPLSSITALELLAGVHATPKEQFQDVKERLKLAYHISRGRVLEDPRSLMCKEILKIPFPKDEIPPFAPAVSRHMDVIRRARSFTELTKEGVPYKSIIKGRLAKIDSTDVLASVMEEPKRKWISGVQHIAEALYPAWRDLFKETGKRLPPEMRKELEPLSAWEPQKQTFIFGLLDWLDTSIVSTIVEEMSSKLDAVLEFAVFVTREFLLRNYNVEKHDSDIFDLFQLQHLAFERFVIVSGDPDLFIRTRRSPQASRIMTLDAFLRTL